jgi:hypothetical protein
MPNDVSEKNGPVQVSGSGSVNAGGASLPALNGLASEILWADRIRIQIGASFDRLAASIEAGTNRYRGLEPAEVSTLLGVLEEHRGKVLSHPDAQHFLDRWQDPVDRVQRLIHSDDRWKSIVEARSVRNPRPDVLVPLRYMGFDDAAGIRIFKFGRLPATSTTPVFRVHAPVGLFLKHKISLQDGPSMCSAIMAAAEAATHILTDEDCLAWLSQHPARADAKHPKRKPAIPPAA